MNRKDENQSDFRRRGRKIGNIILLVNAIGALVVVLVIVAFIVWLGMSA